MRLPELLFSSSPAAILVVALLKATIALALAQWVVASVRSLSAASRHLLLSLALSSFLVIPLVSLALPRLVVPVAVPAEAASIRVPAQPVPPAQSAIPQSLRTQHAALSTPQSPRMTGSEILALLWLAGTLFVVARLLIAAARLHSIVRAASVAPADIADVVEETRREIGVRAPVRALVSSRVAVPMIWGVRAGTLLLPSNATEWSSEQLRATIVHELGHLQRLDYVALALMNLVASLFWFHPQVWTARRRALTEGEHACDDLVLRSGARASEYASHLLSVARQMPRREPLAAILAMSRPTQLEGRMVAILSPSINRKAVGGKLLMAFAFMFALLVAPFATVQLAAEAPVQLPAVMVNATFAQDATFAQEDGGGAPVERHSHRTHSMNTRTETGTCADFEHDFDSAPAVRSEQTLTYAGNALEVASENGVVSVRHEAGNSFGITACKSAPSAQALSQIQVLEQNGKISSTGPDGEDWVVDLIITVPDSRSITVKGQNGPVSFHGVNATIDASVQNGPLTFHDSHGDIKGRAVNGPLSIAGVSGNVDVATQNGPLSLNLDGQAWTGGELRARVGNGPISLRVPDGYQTGISLHKANNSLLRCTGDICGDLQNQIGGPHRAIDTTIGSSPARIFLEGGNGPLTVKQGAAREQ